MEIGECPKVHDLALRADYQIAAKSKEYYYELDVSYHYIDYYYISNLEQQSLKIVGVPNFFQIFKAQMIESINFLFFNLKQYLCK